MKRIIALALCVGFVFALTGCQKKSPEEIEQQISKQLGEAKYMDAQITGSVAMNIPDAGVQKLTLDAAFKSDISGSFPKILLDGTIGLEGVMSFPLSFYFDENKAAITILGQSQETPIPEDTKSQMQMLIGEDSVQMNLNKTVTATKYNEQDALQLDYDLATINRLMNSSAASGSQVSINSFTAYYLLKNNNELDAIAAKMSITADGETMEMDFNIKFNSIGQPIEITPVTGSETIEPAGGTERTLDLLNDTITRNAA